MTRPPRVASCAIPTPLVEPLDLSQDGIERVLQRAVDRIALRRPQFVEVGVNPLARIELGLAVAAPKIPGDILSRAERPA